MTAIVTIAETTEESHQLLCFGGAQITNNSLVNLKHFLLNLRAAALMRSKFFEIKGILVHPCVTLTINLSVPSPFGWAKHVFAQIQADAGPSEPFSGPYMPISSPMMTVSTTVHTTIYTFSSFQELVFSPSKAVLSLS